MNAVYDVDVAPGAEVPLTQQNLVPDLTALSQAPSGSDLTVNGLTALGALGPYYRQATSLDMEEIETWAIQRALRQTGGNVSHAAKLLGMSRDTLHTKIKKKGIDRDALANTPAPVSASEAAVGIEN